MALKLLFIQDSLGTGGAERSNADLWYYLQEQDVTLKVIVLRKRTEGVQKEVLERGIDVVFLPPGSLITHSRKIANLIKDFQPHVVHSVLFKSNLRTRLAKLFGARFVHVESLVNTTYDDSRLQDPAVNKFKLRSYQLLDALTVNLFTDALHAITEVVANHYQQKLRIPTRKMKIIPRGRYENTYLKQATQLKTAYQQQLAFDKEEFLIISTGRQEFQKGHIYLLDALSFLKKQGFTTFKYIILGREGHATPAIEERLNLHDLKNHVIRLGHRNDVEKILAIGDVFAFPSLYEGLGVSLIEAQAAGLPIICNDIPVFHEVTRPQENAFLIPSQDTKAWANKLFELAQKPSLRRSMGAISLEHFNENFILDDVHERMLNYFKTLINNK